MTEPSRPGKILVMDDDQMLCTTARLMLERLGYDVVLADCGEQAVALYREALTSDYPVDVAILDLKVAGGLGAVPAARLLLDLDPAAKLIVASGSSGDPEMLVPGDFGFASSLAKPFEVSDLGLAIGEILE